MERIFIPSKGRLENCTFIKFLKENKIPATIVLEVEDSVNYMEKFGRDLVSGCFEFLILPESNKGITYVRNFIKQYTEDNGIQYFWMCDDDLTGLYYREETKMIKSGINVMEAAERQMKMQPQVALMGLEYQQFAWGAGEKHFIYDSFCDSCVMINNRLLFGQRYREYVEGKEDRDFAMQTVKAGHNTMRTTLYAFAAPKNGSNKGGLKEIFYDLGREETCANRMVEMWGADIVARITKDDGRPDVKIRWDKINSPQLGLF